MSGIQAKKVAKYALLPGVFPRLQRLFTSGFSFAAYLMAQIYSIVRLLPANHPYLNPENIGRYNIRNVIAEAANNLTLSTKNIDQIAIFALILMGVVLIVAQIAMVFFSLTTGIAHAAFAPPIASFFDTPNPTNDVAFILLDQIFGIPPDPGGNHFYGSCVAQGIPCALGSGDPMATGPYPWPFHIALHQMFRFYSMGMLMIGVLIFLYFVVVVVAETATSGTPFGQRFQNIWVPIRLIMAIGLLLPLPVTYPGVGTSAAYNSGQYIAFFAAKMGSGLATNGWRVYNNAITADLGAAYTNPLGERETLLALPNKPDASSIAQAMSIIHTCAFTEYMASNEPKTGTGTLTISGADTDPKSWIEAIPVKPYLYKNVQDWMVAPGDTDDFLLITDTTDYQSALDFYWRGDIFIRFGVQGTGKGFDEEPGNIEPTCGEIRIPVSDKRDPSTSPYRGSVEVQKFYFELIRNLWYDAGTMETYVDFSGRMTLKNKNWGNGLSACDIGCSNTELPNCTGTGEDRPCAQDEPAARWKEDVTSTLDSTLETQLTLIWESYRMDLQQTALGIDILRGNWGNAGSWFPRIAQVNGAFADSFINAPQLYRYPKIMERVKEIRQSNGEAQGLMQFNPSGATARADTRLENLDVNAERKASVLYRVMEFWDFDIRDSSGYKMLEGSGIKDVINMIFGTENLYSMTSTNKHVHPLAQLTALGKGLVESSIRNVAHSTMGVAFGGIIKGLSRLTGEGAEAYSKFAQSTAFIGLSAGLVLYYIIPFLPFVYFYFAVASWLKTIFEAMVGIPLWALAHLRLDGDGLPGEAASNGYFLIFEIFIRPILTIFGLIASILIFTAQVRILLVIWQIVTVNVGGYDYGTVGAPGLGLERSTIDEFFFTIIYALVVYMAATSSFKLIDSIPDNILRWMGQGVSSFGDINQDPAEGLTQYAALGGITAGQKAVGGVNQLAGGLGGLTGKVTSGS